MLALGRATLASNCEEWTEKIEAFAPTSPENRGDYGGIVESNPGNGMEVELSKIATIFLCSWLLEDEQRGPESFRSACTESAPGTQYQVASDPVISPGESPSPPPRRDVKLYFVL
jgi:hypothetical protein